MITPSPLAPGVRIVQTTRDGPGISASPFDRFNLGDHVGDDPVAVAHNRAALRDVLASYADASPRSPIPSSRRKPGPSDLNPRFLRQVHGTAVTIFDATSRDAAPREADAAVTRTPGIVLAILTADCLPVILAADDGSEIAAIHAGWRGLAHGVIDATIAAMSTPAARLHAWLGPAISAAAYEVDAPVRDAFVTRSPGAQAAFVATRQGHWSCDLYALARLRLASLGVSRVDGGEHCTATESSRFFSHRRDGRSGRQATLAWIDSRR